MLKPSFSSQKTHVTLSPAVVIVNELNQLAASQRISRSQCVQNIIRAYLETEKTVVVLAGGSSDLLFFDDSAQFRPLIEITSGYTLIEDILIKCRCAGFEKVEIIGEKEVITALMSVVGDGSRLNISVHYEIERESRGTAYTLARARKHVRNKGTTFPKRKAFNTFITEFNNTWVHSRADHKLVL